MLKKLTMLIVLTLITLSCCLVNVNAADSTVDNLKAISVKFPAGKYWNHMGSSKNNPDAVTSTPCVSHSSCHWVENSCNCNSFDNAIQCMGYAHKISYEITGVMPRNNYKKYTYLKASDLRVGDIIRYRWNGHSLCVTGVSGTKISFTDCNWVGRCQIRWDVMDISDIMGFSYVLHLEGNNRKNTDLYFYKNPEITEEVEINKNDAHEVWKMLKGNLNIRASDTTSSLVVGKIPEGETFRVYDKFSDGTYVWGKVLYGNTMGWCALNYAQYVSGSISKPYFKNTAKAYAPDEKIVLEWKQISEAGKYWLYIYDDSGKVVDKYTLSKTKKSKTIKLKKPGEYRARLVAAETLTPSWKLRSEFYSFKIVAEKDMVYVKSLSLDAPKQMSVGESLSLSYQVKPKNATDNTLIYKSSDTSVATVSATGKITAKKCGKVRITCTAQDKKKVKKSFALTVVPGQVKKVKQNYSTAGKLGLSWNKIEGATNYRIYLYNEKTKSYKSIKTVKKNSCVLSLEAGEVYSLKVRAITNSDGNSYLGAFSQEVTGITGPNAPGGFSVKVSSDKATLSWKKVKGATHYVIYRVTQSGNKVVKTLPSTQLTYTVSSLSSGKTYQYKVRSLRKEDDITGYGGFSSSAKFTVK